MQDISQKFVLRPKEPRVLVFRAFALCQLRHPQRCPFAFAPPEDARPVAPRPRACTSLRSSGATRATH
eukprot:477994-Pyramimonas_sp.AAC.1